MTLIEPFARSLPLRWRRRVGWARYVINDLNKPLIDLCGYRGFAGEVARQYEASGERSTRTPGYYDKCGRTSTDGQTGLPSLLARRCVKASVRYNANGEFNQSPDNRRMVLCRPRCENSSRRFPFIARQDRVHVLDYKELLPSDAG